MHHGRKTCERMELRLHLFLISVTDGSAGQLHVSTTERRYLTERRLRRIHRLEERTDRALPVIQIQFSSPHAVRHIDNLILMYSDIFNPLNAELNPICHLLVLLGYSTFMGPCIVSIFQYTCISNKMQRYTVYLYLETALHVSGGTTTHH
jgi:hypothetical protein